MYSFSYRNSFKVKHLYYFVLFCIIMVFIQIELDEELNKQLRLLAATRGVSSKEKVILLVLREHFER